jgi:hypothetical protein
MVHIRHEAGRNNFIILKSQVALNSVEEEIALANDDGDEDWDLEADDEELDASEHRHGVVPNQTFSPCQADSHTRNGPGHSIDFDLCYSTLRRIVRHWWRVVVREINCCASGTRVRSIRLSADAGVSSRSEHDALGSASTAPGPPVAGSANAVIFSAPFLASTAGLAMPDSVATIVPICSRSASQVGAVSESDAAIMSHDMPFVRSETLVTAAQFESERRKSKIKVRPLLSSNLCSGLECVSCSEFLAFSHDCRYSSCA